jgi:hypothetical protein
MIQGLATVRNHDYDHDPRKLALANHDSLITLCDALKGITIYTVSGPHDECNIQTRLQEKWQEVIDFVRSRNYRF